MCYKIRRKSDNKYSCGGVTPSFSSIGKVWKEIWHLKSHIKLIESYYQTSLVKKDYPYLDCEIVEYELREKENSKVKNYLEKRTKKMLIKEKLKNL